ncbi:MAG: 30S ribosomal protein S18 [bacterium]
MERNSRDSRNSRNSKNAKLKKAKVIIKPKICKFCTNEDWTIDYKDVNRLRSFISERGRIIPRRISGSCAKHQRKITAAIKKARDISILPFVAE